MSKVQLLIEYDTNGGVMWQLGSCVYCGHEADEHGDDDRCAVTDCACPSLEFDPDALDDAEEIDQ